MAKFWLATFELVAPEASARSAAVPLAAADARAWSIEIIHEESIDEYAVLFSTADDLINPTKLACRIGFANGAKTCSIWRDRGFPLVDAIIEKGDDGRLHVRSPCFSDSVEMDYDVELVSIAGTMFAAGSSYGASLGASYEQSQQAPDYAFPATWIKRRAVVWAPIRSKVKAVTPTQLTFAVAATRCPSLAPFERGTPTPRAVWSGELVLPALPPQFPPVPIQRTSRVDTFGVPAFRFEDVEVLGFRIDLGDGEGIDEGLAEMVRRLNFHLEPRQAGAPEPTLDAISDFRYRPATRTLMIELLRYGKMKLTEASPPLALADYQSQHELLVRMLVGRVDDDTAQAHDPATYVPAIFVDNPWSKVLGRDVQGFDKWMADFCIWDHDRLRPLRPDGRLAAAGDPIALARIALVSLVTKTGQDSHSRALVAISCPYDTCDDWDAFEKIDLELAMGSSSLAPTRWRQSDFSHPEFRRSFARSAVTETLKGFRSIQVSPIGERDLDKTWITGTFTVDDDVLVARPTGVARLTLYAEPSAPPQWRLLCETLGLKEGGSHEISLPAGSWYRMRCSMNLTIDNGLD